QPLTPEERDNPTPPPPRIGAPVQNAGPGSQAGRAPDDLTCIACGYALSGIELHGKCPECGRPVQTSLEQGLLRFADPMWLDSLKRGANTVAYGMGGGFLIYFACTIGAAVTGMTALALVGFLAGLVMFLSKWIGVWSVAAPNPALQATDNRGPGPAVRKAILIQIVAMVSIIPLTLLGALSGSGITFIVAGTVGIAGFIAWLVEIVGAMRLVRHVAIRVPDKRLAARAGLFSWLVPVFMLALPIVSVAAIFPIPGQMAILFIGAISPFAAFIMYIAAFYSLAGAIDRARFSQQGVGPQGEQPMRHAA
ncbi:MAG: hypothetical protein ACF8QF_05320, partial [Phycisphaerales bacterium]